MDPNHSIFSNEIQFSPGENIRLHVRPSLLEVVAQPARGGIRMRFAPEDPPLFGDVDI
jgi:hypothetical protein